MKTKTVLNRCALLMLSLAPLSAMGEVSHSCTFTLSDWSRQVVQAQDTTLVAYNYAGLIPTPASHHGHPMLPSRRVTLAVPYNATAFTVTVTDSTATDTLETLTIKPTPRPRKRSEIVLEDEPTFFDSAIYATNAFFPASPVMICGDGYYLGEHHQLTLEVYPMRYNPVTRQLRRYTSLSFTVTWTTSAAQGARAIVRADSYARSAARAEAQSMVANPGQVAQFAPPIMVPRSLPGEIIDPEQPGFGGLVTNSVANYTIITTDSLKHALRKLVALKRQKGYSVTVKTVAEIEADSSVTNGDCVALNDTCSYISDTAGKMRQWLRNSFRDNNTQYVLMAGKDVPFRYGYGSMAIPTDWYFCDLNTNWRTDTDSIFAKPNNYSSDSNLFDMSAELRVGRLMSTDASDINDYSSKLFQYELNPGNGDSDYLNHSYGVYLKEFYKEQNGDSICIMQDELSQVFPESHYTVIGRTDVYPNAKELFNQLNDSISGLTLIDSHGIPNAIAVKPKRVGSGIFQEDEFISAIYADKDSCKYDSDVSFDKLQNSHCPGIMYCSACYTTPFEDYYYERFTRIFYGRNMSQSYLFGSNYGGVAYIGHTRDTSLGELGINEGSILLFRLFLQQLNSGVYRLGRVVSDSKLHYAGNNISHETLNTNLMGDPELEIWTSSLTPFSGITVSRTNNSITVSGIDAGDDAAVVSYCNNTSQWSARATNGSITFGLVNPNSTIMVRSHRKLPYIAPLVLQNTTIRNSQYIIASDVVAGRSVDSGRTAGDVTIATGVDYEIEHKGTVTLAPGFKVEKGAKVSITPSDY